MSKIDAKLALVVGQTGNIAAVRSNMGGLVVNMLPNSAIPVVGDSIFVILTDDGNYGLALPVAPPSANLSINLPIATGDVPTVGLYVPVLVDFSCTIIGMRVVMLDVAGAAVSDTCTINIGRTDFATGTTASLNPSAFGPTADYKYEDVTLTDWVLDLGAHDTLQVSLITAPTSAVYLGIALDVVRAAV